MFVGKIIMETRLDTTTKENVVVEALPSSSVPSTSKDRNIRTETSLSEEIERAAQGRTTETVELCKNESASLGFDVVGLRSEQRGELGIYVQEIQPGGIADM